MRVYIYSKCSTCQKALKFLAQKKIPFTKVEITVETPSLSELNKMLEFQGGNVKKLFNTSGQLYKQWLLAEKLSKMPLEEALKLLNQNGMLVKRPFLIDKQIGLLGFNEKEWSNLA